MDDRSEFTDKLNVLLLKKGEYWVVLLKHR